MRLIDADALPKIKFHPLPYTQIVPSDADKELYKRGWNDAVDAIVECTDTIDPVKHGKWKNKQMLDEELNPTIAFRHRCSECGFEICTTDEMLWWHFCPNCGAKMDGGEDEQMD